MAHTSGTFATDLAAAKWEQIDMGNSVKLVTEPSAEILPRVENGDTQGEATYGVVVGGDADGIYGSGAASSDDTTRASLVAGEAVVVVTQGRALARVTGTIALGAKLTQSATVGVLEPALASDDVVAVALKASTGSDISPVDIQREGVL